MLAVVLVGGLGWYELSRPPARVVSLVATLSALAVVGRLAFAAIPNVKPTTDIVLFAGWALGPVPGFAVGALTGLVSNIFFGQGPWTPWQMTAWGLVGVLGGVVARAARGREPRRLPLALLCAAAGFAYGALLDVYQWTLSAEHTTASYLAVSGSSFPYNLAHAVGNFTFALLIGPAFIRALSRYRRRFELRWERPAVVAVVLALAVPVALGTRNRPGGHAAAARARLPGEGPEQRRRLRHGARRVVEPALHGLGGARPGRRRAQPERREAPEADADRLHARAREGAERHRRARAHDPAPARRRRLAAQLRRPRPGGAARRQAAPGRLLGAPRGPHGVRHLRPARVGLIGGRALGGAVAAQAAEQGRRLRLRRGGRLERRGRHRLRAAGARGRRQARLEGRQGRRVLPAPRARIPTAASARRRPRARTPSPPPGRCRACWPSAATPTP